MRLATIANWAYGTTVALTLVSGTAMLHAEQVRRSLASFRICHEGRDLGPVTASVGIASTPERCLPDRLVRTADAALRRAMAEGRDRTLVAEKRNRMPTSRKAAAQG